MNYTKNIILTEMSTSSNSGKEKFCMTLRVLYEKIHILWLCKKKNYVEGSQHNKNRINNYNSHARNAAMFMAQKTKLIKQPPKQI